MKMSYFKKFCSYWTLIAVLIIIFTSSEVKAEDSYEDVWGGMFPHEKYLYADGLCFRVNPANAEEVIIFDDAKDCLMEIPSCYHGTLTIPETICIDGKTYYPTIIGPGVNMDYTLNFKNVLNISSVVKTIENNCFDGIDLAEVNFSEGLHSIEEGCFSNITALKELKFPNSLFKIGSYCFSGMSLEQITFGNGLYRVGDECFNDNVELTELMLPVGLRIIGSNSFSRNFSLKKISIPAWIEYFSNCFNSCPNIEEIECNDLWPAGFSKCFDAVNKSKCILSVPEGTTARYRECSGWKDFSNIVERKLVTSSPEVIGSETSAGDSSVIYTMDGVRHKSAEGLERGRIYISRGESGRVTKCVNQ